MIAFLRRLFSPRCAVCGERCCDAPGAAHDDFLEVLRAHRAWLVR